MDRNSGRRYLDGVSHEIQDLVRAGEKPAAFKLARETMGLGLKEAKEWVEELATRMHGGMGTAYPMAIPSGIGCPVPSGSLAFPADARLWLGSADTEVAGWGETRGAAAFGIPPVPR